MRGSLLSRRGKLGQSAFSPASVAGLLAWYKADSLSLSDGTLIASWTDSSGNGNTAEMDTDSVKPTYKTNIINSKPVVRFDGNDWIRSFDGPVITQPYTIFTVVKFGAAGSDQYACDGASGGNSMTIRKNAAGDWQAFSGSAFSNGAADTSFHIACLIVNGASSNLRVDGGAGTDGSLGTSGVTGVMLGAAANGALNLNGDMAEWMVHSGALSTTNLNLIGGYLNTKYALTWTAA